MTTELVIAAVVVIYAFTTALTALTAFSQWMIHRDWLGSTRIGHAMQTSGPNTSERRAKQLGGSCSRPCGR